MPLFHRMIAGRSDLVFEWIAEGNSATVADENGTPLIRHFAYYGDVSTIKHLLTNGATLDLLGENLELNGAVFHGHWKLCEFLLENGADVNYPLSDTGETPLHSVLCTPERVKYNLSFESSSHSWSKSQLQDQAWS